MNIAKREQVYLLMSKNDGAMAGLVISDENIGALVQKDWMQVLKRTEARQVLEPENYPDVATFYGAAIAEFQEMHPDWRIIFGHFIRVNITGGRARIGERNVED